MVNSLIVIERLSITSWYQNRQLSLQNETTIVAECECAEGYEGSDCGDEGWCPSHFPLFLFFSYYIKGQIRLSYINCETCLQLIYRMPTKWFFLNTIACDKKKSKITCDEEMQFIFE